MSLANSTTVVIGAGANELVAAHLIARSGRKVVVLDGRGALADEAAACGWVPPRIAQALALDAGSLRISAPDPWASAPLPGGGRLELWRDMARSVEAIRRFNARDAARWPEFCERMGRLARLLETICLQPPPDPMSRDLRGLTQLAGLALRARGLGRRGLEDLLRLIPMPVADLLDEWFENDALKGVLGAAGIRGLCQGPRSGGTALRLLNQHVGNPAGVFRPPSSNLREVLAGMPGIEIRRGAEVGRIAVQDGATAGVVMANGETLPASAVVSGADPQRTLLALMDPSWLDPELTRAVRKVRSRGVLARVTLALDRAPQWARLVVAPSLDYLERAYDEVKYGRVSSAPCLDAVSGGTAPGGRHRVDVHLQYAPYAPAGGGWDDARRSALGNLALTTLRASAAGFEAAAVERVRTPRDLEDELGWPQGQEEQAEPALDQWLWMRPLPELARYRTPVAGLYLCGAAMHPGGAVAGAAGYNASRVLIRDLAGAR